MKTSNKYLKKSVINIFERFGLNKSHAKISANALINAELVETFENSKIQRFKTFDIFKNS